MSFDFPDYPAPFQEMFQAALRGEHDGCFALLALALESRLFPTISRSVPQEFPRRIPKHIAQFWDSTPPPDDILTAMESVRLAHPDFTYHRANADSARAFIEAHFGTDIAALYEACPHPAMLSDFWRLCYLHIKGGVYIDADVICHAPVTDITKGAHFKTLLPYSVGNPWCLDNDILIYEAGNPIMQHIMETMFHQVRAFVETGVFENVWAITGPGAMVMGTMNWIAQQLKTHDVPFKEIDSFLTDSGIIFIPHPHIEQALPTYSHFAYQQTTANWRRFRPNL
ncbi:hypothetical protein GM556_03220 [Bombella sp. ESL0378]|uniref:glycosyltransferase family 32 protein n=1 Tax=Bombella sp. ESL0378 TaxID=2676442 RepID=UPI0012D8871E|nr:glycosyltransferase [Bombella sp. ESL0378]MUG04562.1 hypothetical protein [Bombella sp. ESL0378]